MRTLRSYIINLFSIVGIVATFATLFILTGILAGTLTLSTLNGVFNSVGSEIMASRISWGFGLFCGWLGAAWLAIYLIRTRTHPPILIMEDGNGAVEITTDALCNVARTEARTRGVKGPCKVEFTRKLGSPMLQVFCDLTSGPDPSGPVKYGEIIRNEIEIRLRRDFNLNDVKVSVIHQPQKKKSRIHDLQSVS